MAVISKEKIYLKIGQYFNKVVKYSNGIFSIELPEQVCEDLLLQDAKDKKVYASTEGQAKRLFDEKLLEWETAATATKQVILFNAKFQGALAKKEVKYLWDNGYTPSYERPGQSKDPRIWEFMSQQIGFNTSLGLTFQWGVYEKREFKDKRSYTFVSGRQFEHHDISHGNPRGLTEIDHTTEREQFFLQLDQSFAEMIAKIYKALGDLTPEKLQLLADSGLKLLTN